MTMELKKRYGPYAESESSVLEAAASYAASGDPLSATLLEPPT
jgi:hypothetical protein